VKLIRLKADGFGPLRGEFKFDPTRLNLVVGANEAGKSSLLAAITAGLYGLVADRRAHRVLTPVDRWRPWQGDSFRLELELEVDDVRYTVRRDFKSGHVEVWNGDGREVTSEFLHGKDEYPVGTKLLGIDAAEWEKSAFIRQEDLAEVIPAEEKARRSSTLRGRLENAADTHVGDTNATEAVRVIDTATRQYTCDEIGSTMKVENVIKALEARRGMIEGEIKNLDHDLEQITGPLDELARRGEDEQRARAILDNLDTERSESLSADLRSQIAANDELRSELARLRKEARDLEGVADLPGNAEAELRETIARYDEARRNLEALESRRRDEQHRERQTLEGELANLKAFEHATLDDADRFVALAAEIRRIGEADSRLKDTVFSQREALASRGYEPKRIQALAHKFEQLGEDEQRLLRNHSELALGYQTEVSSLEQQRLESTELLREIDVLRLRRRMPGWFIFALGLGAAVAGGSVMVLGGIHELWTGLLVGGLVMTMIGGSLVFSGGRKRTSEREKALRHLGDAQRRLNQMRADRAEAEVGMNEACRKMGYRDPVELLREWSEYNRLLEDSAPVLRAQDGISALETQRKAVLDEVRGMLGRVGGGSPDPTNLERVAANVRHLWATKQRLNDLEQSWSWIDDEKRVAEAAATGLKERAVRILQSVGLPYDPARPWVEHVHELAERLRGKTRHTMLMQELIPQAERRLVPESELADKKRNLATLESERGKAPPPEPTGAKPRSQVEIEGEARKARERIEAVQKWREDLRMGVEEAWRRHHRERPERAAELDRIDRAYRRAVRFKASTDLARETIQQVAVSTHRRWAEHLNKRVTQLLDSFGTGIEEVRFGDDLDFSLRYKDGRQVARGKALLQMSSGALDQVHLAVRLAISEYLSRERAPFPLLVDDAFVTSDDARAAAAMKLLIERMGSVHQIVVATCHAQRYAAFARQDPDLYRDRVHWLELNEPAPRPR
jgi:hypothetical protein